jgi:thiol-disulfide isomerase/thioredoxin
MPSFPELPSADFKSYCGENFDDVKVLVVAFTCNHCPHVHAVEERMKRFALENREHGVCLVAINSNDETTSPDDDYEQMVLRARIHEYSFPYLRDADQEAATLFGATFTPEFFVFDHEHRLRYHGAFDDNWEDVKAVKRRYLPEAVEAILAGHEVEQTETQPAGCTIKWCQSAGEG